MAGADRILTKIMDDARAEAATALDDAREKADALQQKSRMAVEASAQAAMAKARMEAEQKKERRLRMALLDTRKERLAMKRVLIDESFERALERLLGASAEEKKALFLRMLLTSAQGGETILPAEADKKIFTPKTLEWMNEELRKAGKQPVALGDTVANIRGGFLLALEGMECNCSIEALLRQEREALEPEVARALFPKEG